MRRSITIFFLLCCIVLLATAAMGQTYTWSNGAGTNDWGNAANWTPTRTTPATTDTLIFDGSVTPAATDTGVIAQTIGMLKITNDARVTLNVTAARTLAISKKLQIDNGSTLIDSAKAVITINLLTGATGTISGTYRSRSILGGAATAHLLTAADASALTFTSGSICVQDTNRYRKYFW